MPIELLVRDHERVQRLLLRVPQLSYMVLFSGDRWAPVEVVAVAADDDGRDVGLATLAPRDEAGVQRPTIIGLWVAQAARRRGIATALLGALADESHRLYGCAAHIQAATVEGGRAIDAAVAAGVDLIPDVPEFGPPLP